MKKVACIKEKWNKNIKNIIIIITCSFSTPLKCYFWQFRRPLQREICQKGDLCRSWLSFWFWFLFWRISDDRQSLPAGPPLGQSGYPPARQSLQNATDPKMYADFKLRPPYQRGKIHHNRSPDSQFGLALRLSWWGFVSVQFCSEWHFLNWSGQRNKCSANLLCYLINIIKEQCENKANKNKQQHRPLCTHLLPA